MSTNNDRFHLPPPQRLVITGTMASLFGFVQGSYGSYHRAGQRFLVENSHRLPTTKGGWYWYHKRKNWVCLKSAVDSGVKRAGKFGVMAFSFFGVEAWMDQVRGKVDALNTVVSSIVCGFAYSRCYRLPLAPTKQLLVNGIALGAVFGLVQDGLIALRGGEVWYTKRLVANC